MTIASIDLGKRRIGLALAYGERAVVLPLEIIGRKSLAQDLAYIARRLKELEVSQLVIGLPLNMDGSEGPMARMVRKFAEEMEKVTGLPVALFDERLTSMEARERMREAGIGSARRGRVDALAAAIILEGWLNRTSPDG
jgi:putative holliday junction resolvase